MNCMRCGREIQDNQVFCPECLAEMEKCPVRPDAPVRLPRRPDPALRRSSRKKGPPEEEQVRSLKKQVVLLRWVLAAAIAAIIFLTIPMVQDLVEENIALLPGQNYSSDTAFPADGE